MMITICRASPRPSTPRPARSTALRGDRSRDRARASSSRSSGRSGSGKSTLLNLVAGHRPPADRQRRRRRHRAARLGHDELAAWRGRTVGHRVPVLPAAADAHRGRERDAADGLLGDTFRRAQRARRGRSSCSRASACADQADKLPADALGRPAAARRDRARARQRPAADRRRRAHRQPRLGDQRRDLPLCSASWPRRAAPWRSSRTSAEAVSGAARTITLADGRVA